MSSRSTYLEDIERGVTVLKTHYSEIKAFADRHQSRAAALLHAVSRAVPDERIVQNDGLRDAAALLDRVGAENCWMLSAMLSAYCAKPPTTASLN